MEKYNTFNFSNLHIYSGSISGVVNIIYKWITLKEHTYICVTGAHGIVESMKNISILQAHAQAGLVVPDGMPLTWIGRMLGYKNTDRVYGPDLMLATCKKAETEGWRIFLYGTTKETLKKLIDELLQIYPQLKIVGHYSPPFRPLIQAEDTAVIKKINSMKPHILFVGLSTPKQELWMREHARKFNANVFIGVGAAFDFIAGTKRQAPPWMRRIGMEWLFRFFQEPHRLWYRSTVTNMRFLLISLESFLKIKTAERPG